MEYDAAMSLHLAAAGSCLVAAVLGAALLACSGSETVNTSPTTTTTSAHGGGGSGAATTTSTGGLGGQGGQGGQGGSGATGGGAGCPPAPACDNTPPDPGQPQDWNNVSSSLIVLEGASRHRGRDLYLAPDDPQWVLGKFAYGLGDDDLPGEAVDIYLDRNCAGTWEKLGTATTSNAGQNATVEGIVDDGARIYFQIPVADKLEVGRHRIHMVVLGDLSTAEQIIEVINFGTSIFVADVDGTLTTSDTETWTSLLTGNLPANWPSSAEALTLLASKGMRPFYLTARPEWLDPRTREFLVADGYPPGVMHTTLDFLGATGAAAATFKTAELAVAVSKGAVIQWAFGNADTDAEAYDNADVQPLDHRVFVGLDDTYGGRRIDDWSVLLSELNALPPVCSP